MSTSSRFTFSSSGEQLVGNLFAPDGAPKAIAVLTGPLTSVKEQAAGAYARALADRGYAALAFDHRTFGESGGAPRQLENPFAKVEDLRAAAAALHAIPAYKDLPVFGVGVCAGGGYMARAVSEEPLFAGFAGIAGVYGAATPADQAAKDVERARAAEKKWRETGVADHIPAVAADNGDVAMPLTEAYEFYGTPRGAVPNYTNAFAVQSKLYTTAFDSQIAAPLIKVPTIVVHSEHALAPPWAKQFIANLRAPHEQVWLDSLGQIDFYDDPRLINQASDAIINYFA